MPREDFAIPVTDGQVTLTTADTAYQVPAAAHVQSVPHELVLCNNSTANIMVRAVTGTTGGTRLAAGGTYAAKLAPSQVLFAYSTVALQTINYSLFKIA